MTKMRDLIAELPAQLRWAADLDPPAVPEAQEALVSGMGGSGIAGSIAAVIADDAGSRVSVRKSYGLPGWAERVRPLVVAVSHSGNTEETLDAVDAATIAGLPVAAVTTGGRLAGLAEDRGWPVVKAPQGPQPRAAVGCLTGGALRVLEAAGLLPAQSDALHEAADVVAMLLGDGAGPGVALADDLGDAVAGRVAVVYGGEGAGAVAANRWKTQINENGKSPAWWSVLPELDHNEIVGWGGVPALSADGVAVVSLHVPGEHPRISLRSDITEDLMDGVGIAGRVDAVGESLLAKLFSLIVIGDLVSVAIAERVGADPMPVDVIEDLKGRLAAEGT
jgi:glucose/mannose-6-phosphate isomerase